ncbi:LysR substrate-binding domain-containing protein [Erythrobacter sp. GH1-10]|uniref:LysR substrate-binding domain-containing protein n=1 Tax=Erythrobacter sp. GH1-10 TaxID=3349334 RepID=UPI00387823E4
MPSLPPLSAIRAFEAAARHKNFTRAGEELGLTQAGVSYQIKSLEERVGMVLFVREGRSMELTPAGEALAPRISQAFATMQSAFSALSDTDDSVLTIACFETFAAKLLASRLGGFQLAHPEIAVRLDVGNHFVDLEAGDADLAIRLSRDVPSSLEAHDLMPLEIAPFAHPDFIAQHPELLDDDPAIPASLRLSPRTAWWQAWDEARCASGDDKGQSGKPRGLQFESQVLDSAAAMSGNGVAILAPALFHAEMENGQLAQIGTQVARTGPIFRLIYPEVRRHSTKVRAFRAWLMEEFGPIFAAHSAGT